jgi:hypothetical protein
LFRSVQHHSHRQGCPTPLNPRLDPEPLPVCINCLQPRALSYSLPQNASELPFDPVRLQQQFGPLRIVYTLIPDYYSQPRTEPPGNPAPLRANISEQPSSCRDNRNHNCVCGPQCQCVGCLTHPFNHATQQYVQSAFRNAEATLGDYNQSSGPGNAALTEESLEMSEGLLGLDGRDQAPRLSVSVTDTEVFPVNNYIFLGYCGVEDCN